MTTTHSQDPQTVSIADQIRRRFDHRLVAGVERYMLVLLLGAVILFFSFYSKTSDIFATRANFENIAGNESILTLVAIAALVPLVCGQFDLSVGATVGVSSLLTAHALSSWNSNLWLAGLLGVAVGAFVGLVNGFAVARVGLNSLIVTLGVATVLGGLSSAISLTPIVTGIPNTLTGFGSGDWLGVPRLVYVLVLVAVAVYYVLEHTPLGREVHAVGSSVVASRLVGIPVDRRVLCSFVTSGAIAGLAGVLQLARSGSGDPAVGPGFTLPAIAAAFLGATAIRPGRFNVLGTFVAIAFLAAIVSGLTIGGASSWLEQVVDGSALVLGIAISTVIARQRAKGG